jgi:hypothetical protein
LHRELWLITRIALRNYLKNPMEYPGSKAPGHWEQLVHWFRMFPFVGHQV